MKTITCPQCGAKKNNKDDYEKLFVCEHCHSLFFIENITKIKHSLILQKQTLTIRNKSYKLLDARQLKHENGITTQWQIQDEENNLFILIEDDENFSLVADIQCKVDESINWSSLLPNTQLQLLDKEWVVTEKIEFQEINNSKLQYSYLTSVNAELLVLVFNNKHLSCRQGFWLDAFEIL